jgi:hypothetical protein
MKIKYVKSTTCLGLSAKQSEVVGKELSLIQKEHSVITPKVVVESARPKDSPLHQYFEWDNSEAAEKYREWQARFLICSVYIIASDEKDAQAIRAFVNVLEEDKGDLEDPFITGRGYVAITSMATRQSYQIQVLDYARAQLLGWRKRFGNYKEFFGVVSAIDQL